MLCVVGRRIEYRLKNRAFRMIELYVRDRRSTAHSSPELAAAVSKKFGKPIGGPFESPTARVGSLRSTDLDTDGHPNQAAVVSVQRQ